MFESNSKFIKLVHMRAKNMQLIDAVGASPNNEVANAALLAWIYFAKGHDHTISPSFTNQSIGHLGRIQLLAGVSDEVVAEARATIKDIYNRIYSHCAVDAAETAMRKSMGSVIYV